MAAAEIQGSRVRCPDCRAWLELTITLGESKRTANGVTLPAGFDERQFLDDMTAHIAANPAKHTSFVS